MNWLDDPDLASAEENTPMHKTYKPIHASISKIQQESQGALYDTSDFLADTRNFSIDKPGSESSDPILAIQNPGLYAMRNRASKNTKPILYSPLTSTKKAQSRLQTSLGKRLLSSLRNSGKVPHEMYNQELKPEELSIDFDEEPIAYFSKHKDGHGLRFIYLIYAQNPSDPDFSPYNLRKVTSAEIGNDYFMMSATGVTHVDPSGFTESISLDQWAREESIFQSVRRLKIFQKYCYWYPFTIWKKFVLRRRYEELQQITYVKPIFKNPEFFINELQFYISTSLVDKMIFENLFAFETQKMYTLPDFQAKSKDLKDNLKAQYFKYIEGINHKISKDIYSKLSDKQLIEVADKDFWKGRKNPPNITQLANLEKKKSELRKEKTDNVNKEIKAIGNMIRSVDYMILENLVTATIDAFENADSVFSTDMSSVFKVEVVFTDKGQIELTPSLGEIEKAIAAEVQISMKLVNSLPRILHETSLCPFIRDAGLDIENLYRYGPNFLMLIHSRKEHIEAEKHILDIIRKSYNEAVESTRSFAEYYNIFKLGQDWNAMEFLFTRKGDEFKGVISEVREGVKEDDFLINSGDEPVVDFEEIDRALKGFVRDQEAVTNIRQRTSKGALFIDSSNFRSILLPIPKKGIDDIKDLITKLVKMKIALTENVLNNYSIALNAEPKSLESYISLCELVKRTEQIKPAINEEIDFVNKGIALLSKYKINTIQVNPLDKLMNAFSEAEQVAIANKTKFRDEYSVILQKKVEDMEKVLSKLYSEVTSIPSTLDEVSKGIKMYSERAKEQKEKISALQDEINKLVSMQQITGIEFNDFSFYQNIIKIVDQMLLMFSAIQDWVRLTDFTTNSPFSEIDVENFLQTFNHITSIIEALNVGGLKTPVFDELKKTTDSFKLVLTNLQNLSNAPMHQRHWESLYAECNCQEKYSQDVTIKQLMQYGILSNDGVVAQVTSFAHAEAEVELEFVNVHEHWHNVKLQLQETMVLTEDTLNIAPIDPIITNIADSLIVLEKIQANPYSGNIRNQCSDLIQNLNSCHQILESWFLFQRNFNCVATIFKSDEARKMLPKLTEKYVDVQNEWHKIARHVMNDTRLFSVCSYPDLYTVIRKMDKVLEEIISSSSPLIDKKRQLCPRLNFLSDLEILKLITTKSFESFTHIVVKMLMGVVKFDTHENEQEYTESFQRMKIYGLIGQHNDTCAFLHQVGYTSDIETLVNDIIEAMQAAMREHISVSLVLFPTMPFAEWVQQTSTYTAIICLNIIITREVLECFKTLESHPKAFLDFEQLITRRINDAIGLRSLNIPEKDRPKVASIIIFLISIRDRFRELYQPRWNYQQELAMNNILNYSFAGSTNDVIVEHGTSKWNFGYEYWGSVPRLIFTPEIESVYQDVAASGSLFGPTLISGPSHSGKILIARTLASMFGSPAFVFNSFPEINAASLKRIVIGTSTIGAWTIIAGLERMTPSRLSYLFDCSWQINSLNNTGKINIEGIQVPYSKQSRILFTTSAKTEKIPTQIRSFARTVAMRVPDLEIFAQIKLLTTGFHDYGELAPKLVAFLKSIKPLFSFKTPLPEMNAIIENAANFRRTGSEDAMLASACYDFFESQCDHNVLTHLVYAAFRLGDSFEELIEKVEYARYNEDREAFRALIIKECSRLNVKIPTQFFVNNVVTVKELLMNRMCVIIVGPPHTGKSLITKVLENVMKQPEFKKSFPKLKPFKVINCYMNSDLPRNIYGETVDGIYRHGQIISIVNEKIDSRKDYNVLLKFDGPITKEFDSFITSFLGTPDLSSFGLGSIDTYHKDSGLPGILIETTDISHASPSLIARSAIVMSCEEVEKQCVMLNPMFTLSHAASFARDLTSDSIASIFEIFKQVAPSVVNKIYNTPNPICYAKEPQYTNDNSRYISEVLPYQASVYALNTFMKNKEMLSTQQGILTVIVFTIMHVFSGILNEKEQSKFEKWIREKYDIKIDEWPEYMPSDFLEAFPTPTLNSVCIEFNKLRPLDASICSKQGGHVIPPAYLPIINHVTQIMYTNLNLLLYSPDQTRLDLFLAILYQENPDMKPLSIHSSNDLSAANIARFIEKMTNYSDKNTDWDCNYVLVVENITETHIIMMEFLRMIIEESKVRLSSPYDPKFIEFIKLPPIRIIVTTNDISTLPGRFLSHFLPIRLDELNASSSRVVGKKYLQSSGLSALKCEWISKFIVDVFEQLDEDNISRFASNCAMKINQYADKANTILCTKMIIALLYYYTLHKYDVNYYKDVVMQIADETLPTPFEKKVVQEFLDYSSLCNVGIDKDGNIELIECSYEQYYKNIAEMYNKAKEKHEDIINFDFSPLSMRSFACLSFAIKDSGKNIIFIGHDITKKLAYTKFYAYANDYNFVHMSRKFTRREFFEKLNEAFVNAMDDKKTMFFVEPESVEIAEEFLKMCTNVCFTQFFNCDEKCNCSILKEKMAKKFGDKKSFKEYYECVDKLLSSSLSFVVSTHEPISLTAGCYFFAPVYPTENDIKYLYTRYARESEYESFFVDTVPDAWKYVYNLCFHAHPDGLPSEFISKFIHIFFNISKQRNKELDKHFEKCTIAAQCFLEMDHEMKNIQLKLNLLNPNLNAVRVDSETLSRSYNVRKESIESRREVLNHDLSIKKEELEKLESIVSKQTEKYKSLEPLINENRQQVESLTSNDIKTILIATEDPSPFVRSLLECLCIFMNKEPDFDKNGVQLLHDEKFVETILNNVKPFVLGPYEQGQLKRFLSREEFKKINWDLIPPGLKYIFDYIVNIEAITAVREELNLNATKLETLTDEYNKLEETTNNELKTFESVEIGLAKDEIALKELTQQLEKYEAEHKQLSERLAVLSKLADSHELLRNSWENDLNNMLMLKREIIVSDLLFAYSTTYLLSIHERERKQKFEEGKDIVKPILEVKEDYNEFMSNFMFKQFPDHSVNRIDCISGNTITIAITIAMHLMYTVLVVDKNGFALKAFESVPGTKIVSQSISNIDNAIKDAMEQGTVLVITDIHKTTPLLLDVCDQLTPNGGNKVFHNNETIEVKEGFKVVLYTAGDLHEVPENLNTRIITIRCDTDRSPIINDYFNSVILQFLKKDDQKDYIAALAVKRQHKIQTKNSMQKALDIITAVDADTFLLDVKRIDEFCESKNSYMIGAAENESIPEEAAYYEEIAPFKEHVELLATIWFILSQRIILYAPYVTFDLECFGTILYNCLTHDGISSKCNESLLKKLKSSLIISCIQNAYLSLSFFSATLFAFRLAYYRDQKIDIDKQQVTEILNAFCSRVDDQLAYDSRFIPDKVDIPFILGCAAPDILPSILKYIKNNTVENFLTLISPFQAETMLSSSSTQATLVIAPKDADPTPLIYSYAMQRSHLDALCVVSITESKESISIAEKELSQVLKTGSLAIIHYTTPSEEAASVIADVHSRMKSGQADPNFRLIVVCHSPAFLPERLISEAKKMSYEPEMFCRLFAQQLFTRHSSAIQVSTNTVQIKKLSFSILLQIILANSRSFFRHGGFINQLTMNVASFADIVRQVPLIVAASPSDVQCENLYQQIMRLVFPGISDPFDRRLIDAMCRSIISPEVLNEGFSITGDPKSAWTVPGDIPISSIAQQLVSLPLIPEPKAVGMSKSAARIRDLVVAQTLMYEFGNQLIQIQTHEDMQKTLQENLEKVPRCLSSIDPKKFSSAKGLFLLHEVEKFNEVVSLVSSTIENTIRGVKESIPLLMNKVPEEWKSLSKIYSFNKPSTFINHLKDIHAQYSRWLQESISPVVDASCIFDLNAFLNSHLVEVSLQKKKEVNHLEYKFSIAKEKEELEDGDLLLCGIYLAFGDVDEDGSIVLPKEDEILNVPFKKLPGIICKPIEIAEEPEDEEQMMRSQVLQSQGPPTLTFPLISQATTVEGVSEAEWGIDLTVTGDEYEYIRAGTAFYANVQEQFI
ncbi:Dynein heavy chain family protein [Trichomonas vaginalis G3]|uniref:Dynein heavy chain family protein n=1 Tax=Trichomonas vaginalis (strain ATCC PRA-98 / G3) TaxID=412133 RepID=A2E034_TRIV3|nr:dynein heavy chain family protein family [Trichomonas vaginalis G3]EAY13953.1 Dynein heavy chain family protein [Trichomonas vaginalis G3]KAI5551764.1 dynein heavy chain family protein family [Trichomonas vaginalis G3]|eukprot:XP_001326176.1 Dynein heavy chain family protein [Trichomonas vaginalis G3]